MLLPALPPQPIPLCVSVLAIAAASTDLAARRIPNPLIVLGLAAALAVRLWLEGTLLGAGHWLAGALTGFALLIPLYFMRGTSAGDVKLLMAIGAWVGPAMVVEITLAAFVVGGIWSIAFIARGGHTAQVLANLRRMIPGLSRAAYANASASDSKRASVGSMPYGVAIAAGTIGMLFAAV
ncbi:prepilin peptidase [Trinickia caryophylli]|uniref:Prepilin peptidase CpaA n=1 Tax=Trinickia caryophylli TaxID=28094 RepID=A0A1X7CWM5_TRICW|nr:prepilin peptidase [Trinickia caryophylli]PMS13443.1 peptidase A24 [Trinickia caryophylli]TRX13700.1 prepilin peptidase [Trinickia caryophylli]WQE15286.1 prepilin peptidase [Trinickia caryophylli]SMF04498.1 prepilin peptidase CpaA [Trinickia caryophylli]GLU30962.1 pilus assembly-related outer membrane protein [Trinickia caryophylli]